MRCAPARPVRRPASASWRDARGLQHRGHVALHAAEARPRPAPARVCRTPSGAVGLHVVADPGRDGVAQPEPLAPHEGVVEVEQDGVVGLGHARVAYRQSAQSPARNASTSAVPSITTSASGERDRRRGATSSKCTRTWSGQEPGELRVAVRILQPARPAVVAHAGTRRAARRGPGSWRRRAAGAPPRSRRRRRWPCRRGSCRRPRGSRARRPTRSPFAEWIVESTSQSSSSSGGPARSPVEDGGSSVSSARNRPRVSYAARQQLQLFEVAQPRAAARRSAARTPARGTRAAARAARRAACAVSSARQSAAAPTRSACTPLDGAPSGTADGLVEETGAAATAGRRRARRTPSSSISRARRGRPDAVGQLQHAEPAHLVERVLQHAQQRERVLHVRRLQELQPAVLHERDVAARQLHLQQVAVVRRAEQHRLLLQRRRPPRGAAARCRTRRRTARPRPGRCAASAAARRRASDHSVFVVALRRRARSPRSTPSRIGGVER